MPSAQRQMVGPFIFFDQMGPAEFLTGKGVDVRPHPHIGLSTVTYLLKGRMHHRDSLGTDAWIAPGEVNLMQAGHGITHSERTDGALPQTLFGLQTWLALSRAQEDAPPAFHNLGADALPLLEAEGKSGAADSGQRLGGDSAAWFVVRDVLRRCHTGRRRRRCRCRTSMRIAGSMCWQGEVTQGGQTYGAGAMLVFRPGDGISVKAGAEGARIMVLGGATMDGPRHIWWNFVASSEGTHRGRERGVAGGRLGARALPTAACRP